MHVTLLPHVCVLDRRRYLLLRAALHACKSKGSSVELQHWASKGRAMWRPVVRPLRESSYEYGKALPSIQCSSS